MNADPDQPVPDHAPKSPGDSRANPTPDAESSLNAEHAADDDLFDRLLEGKADVSTTDDSGLFGDAPLDEPALLMAGADADEVMVSNRPRSVLPSWFLPAPGPRDRWAHRRGEPRTFAFLWTLYLLLATVVMFWKVLHVGTPTLDIYRPAMRVLLITASVGATIIWPMVRLCQESPRAPRMRHAWADITVIMLPMQAVIWPQFLLAQWAGPVILAVDLLIGAWVALIGLLVLWGWGRRGLWRAAPLGLAIVILSAGPVVGMVARAVNGAGSGLGDWAMSSPFTGIFALTRAELTDARRGLVESRQWILIGTTWSVAIAAWIVALASGMGKGRASDSSVGGAMGERSVPVGPRTAGDPAPA